MKINCCIVCRDNKIEDFERVCKDCMEAYCEFEQNNQEGFDELL